MVIVKKIHILTISFLLVIGGIYLTVKGQQQRELDAYFIKKIALDADLQSLREDALHEGPLYQEAVEEMKEQGYNPAEIEKIYFKALDEHLEKKQLTIDQDYQSENDKDDCFLIAYQHYQNRDFKEALKWAYAGAELGSSESMLLLRNAYGHGSGVIQDTEECLKWLFLAGALGDDQAQKEITNLEATLMLTLSVSADPQALAEHHDTQWNAAKQKASNWMGSHSNLFFIPKSKL